MYRESAQLGFIVSHLFLVRLTFGILFMLFKRNVPDFSLVCARFTRYDCIFIIGTQLHNRVNGLVYLLV